MLSSLNLRHNKHLSKLLATFRREGQYHLIFPYANANLRDYWRKIPYPYHNRETYLWVVDQLTGLASALDAIHDYDSSLYPLGSDTGNKDISRLRPSAINGVGRLAVRQGEELFGRHGDLKPENLLWLDDPSNPTGIIQVTDVSKSLPEKESRS